MSEFGTMGDLRPPEPVIVLDLFPKERTLDFPLEGTSLVHWHDDGELTAVPVLVGREHAPIDVAPDPVSGCPRTAGDEVRRYGRDNHFGTRCQ